MIHGLVGFRSLLITTVYTTCLTRNAIILPYRRWPAKCRGISARSPDLSCVPAPKGPEQDLLLPQQSPLPASRSNYCLPPDYTLSQGGLIIWVRLSLSSAVLGKPLPSASSFRDQLFFGRERGLMTMKSFHFFFLQLLTRPSKPDRAPPHQRGEQREPRRFSDDLPRSPEQMGQAGAGAAWGWVLLFLSGPIRTKQTVFSQGQTSDSVILSVRIRVKRS